MIEDNNIEALILASIGITKGARELASSVYDLQKSDSNVDKVNFSRHSLNGYAGAPFLVADVELKQPFSDVEQFRTYLKSHNFPSDNSSIILESEDPLNIGFQTNAYTSDAFCARFYQPYRIRAKED